MTMDANELRALAEALLPMAAAPCFDGIDIGRAAAYLRAQADAQPVAWIAHNLTTGHVKWTTDRCRARGWTRVANLRVRPLYPAPAAPQAEPKREPLSDEQVESVVYEAEKRLRKHRSAVRGQMIVPADTLEWWIVRCCERAHGIGGSDE